MGETHEWDSGEETGFQTRDGVRLAIKKSGGSSIFLRVGLHPACQVSDQAVQSPLWLRVLWVENLSVERRVGTDARQLTAEVEREAPHPVLPLQVSFLPVGICWGDEMVNDHAFAFFWLELRPFPGVCIARRW